MKSILIKLIAVFVLILPLAALADTYVQGYFRDDGSYVLPYVRSDQNSTNLDNYSTKGNQNPYSGSDGIRAKDYSPEALNYGQGREIQTGPRGGQYYLNDNGRKVYVPKR